MIGWWINNQTAVFNWSIWNMFDKIWIFIYQFESIKEYARSQNNVLLLEEKGDWKSCVSRRNLNPFDINHEMDGEKVWP